MGTIEVEACVMHEGELSPLVVVFHTKSSSNGILNQGVTGVLADHIPRLLNPQNLRDDTQKEMFQRRGITDNMLSDVHDKLLSNFLGASIYKADSLATIPDVVRRVSKSQEDLEARGVETSFQGCLIRSI